jgi:hypothetical protein
MNGKFMARSRTSADLPGPATLSQPEESLSFSSPSVHALALILPSSSPSEDRSHRLLGRTGNKLHAAPGWPE